MWTGFFYKDGDDPTIKSPRSRDYLSGEENTPSSNHQDLTPDAGAGGGFDVLAVNKASIKCATELDGAIDGM